MRGYKLLIVDDEEIEREGMAKCIRWGEYGIELVETAWNGVEGFEKIGSFRPDIVLTDIKMPVMNGIELIRRARREFPDIEFVVLSGYGEYEYTSQAMEEGVRHYILKPCDEDKIMKVMDKVKADIEEKHQKNEQIAQYSDTIRNFLPRAKEQVFYNLLMGREQIQEDCQLFMKEVEKEISICVLTIRLEKEIDSIVQFVLQNILEELLGREMLFLATAFSNEMVFCLHDVDADRLCVALRRMRMELERLAGKRLEAALSQNGRLEDIRTLYLQTAELFCMGGEKSREALLTYNLFREARTEINALVNYAELGNAEDMEHILTELYLVSGKMKIKGYSEEKKRQVYQWIRKVFGKVPEDGTFREEDTVRKTEWEIVRETAKVIAREKMQGKEAGQEEMRMEQILFAVFEHLPEQELNIRYLAREVLFINEDYFGRLFQRCKKMKFSTWLLQLRITLAGRFMRYSPDTKVSDVAGMVGFPEDGQYFSKVFRKATGMTPSQYREAEAER